MSEGCSVSGNGEDVHRSGQCRPGSGADATRRRPLTRAARPRRWPATIRICIPPWSRHPSISKHTHRRLGNTHPTTSQDNKRPSAVCRESPTIGAFSDGAVGVADGVPTGRAACRDAALWTAPKRVIHTEQGRPEPCACVHWSSGGVAQLTRPLLLEASWLPGRACRSRAGAKGPPSWRPQCGPPVRPGRCRSRRTSATSPRSSVRVSTI